MVYFSNLGWFSSLIRQSRFSAVTTIFAAPFFALWATFQTIVSISFYILREHFRNAMERAIIHLGHVFIYVAVICAGACIIAAGLGKLTNYTCSLSILSRLPVCRDLHQAPSGSTVPSGPPLTIDPHVQTYEKVLDDFARGAPLALSLMKAERLVVELVNVVEAEALSFEFKYEFRTMFSTFSQEAQGCRTELETLDSAAMGLFLQWV